MPKANYENTENGKEICKKLKNKLKKRIPNLFDCYNYLLLRYFNHQDRLTICYS